MLKDKIEKKTSIKTQHWIIKLKKITKKNDVYRAIQCSMYKTGAGLLKNTLVWTKKLLKK
jgi:hypothetical protein